MKLLVLFTLLGLFGAQSFGHYQHYNGYKTYRIKLQGERDIHLLKGLSTRNVIDIWNNDWRVGGKLDVMVSPSNQKRFEGWMKVNRLMPRVLIDDVEQIIGRQRREQSLAKSRFGKKVEFDQYYSYEEIQTYIRDLAATYPSLVTVVSLGKTYENRTQDLVRISTGGDGTKPAIFIDAGIHAREWAASASALYLIQQLVEYADQNQDVLDNVDWHIVPVANPDGYQYTWDVDRMWRKTREPAGNGCIGTDPNRNYDYHWGESGASPNPCAEDFQGDVPFSVPESRNMRDYETAHKAQIKAYIAVHTYGEVILYPYSYDDILPEDWEDLDALGWDVSQAIETVRGTKFDVGLSADLMGTTAGSSDDWAKGALGIKYAYTIELYGGWYGFVLPPSELQPVVEETFEGLRAIGKKVATLR